MLLTCTEEEYPGYKRQTFECSVCGGTMTQWAAVAGQSGADEFENRNGITLQTLFSGPRAPSVPPRYAVVRARLVVAWPFLLDPRF